MPRHELLQVDSATTERLDGFEALNEARPGGQGLETTGGARFETSIPRSARSTITPVAESGWARDQRTASRITSGGQREPEKADTEAAVHLRRPGRHP